MKLTEILLLTNSLQHFLYKLFLLCIDQLTSDGDLAGVGVVEDERAWLGRARREVESQGKRMLLQGLELLVRLV